MEAQCCICLNGYVFAWFQRRTLPCGHSFCTACVRRWKRAEGKTCPLCRAPMVDLRAVAGKLGLDVLASKKRQVPSNSPNRRNKLGLVVVTKKITFPRALAEAMLNNEQDIDEVLVCMCTRCFTHARVQQLVQKYGQPDVHVLFPIDCYLASSGHVQFSGMTTWYCYST